MAGKTRTAPWIHPRVVDGHVMGLSTREIFEAIESDHRWVDGQVTLRTVQRYIRELRGDDDQPTWSIDGPYAEPALPVITVLGWLVQVTGGRATKIGLSHARWIQRVQSANPKLPPHVTWRLAQRFMARRAQRESIEDLELWMAMFDEPYPSGLEWIKRYVEIHLDKWPTEDIPLAIDTSTRESLGSPDVPVHGIDSRGLEELVAQVRQGAAPDYRGRWPSLWILSHGPLLETKYLRRGGSDG